MELGTRAETMTDWNTMRLSMRTGFVLLLGALFANAAEIKTVHFQSEDQRTRLVAYLFEPQGPGPHAAIVLLHGRAGPYSSAAKGVYTAARLSKRHQEWGTFWAARGYYALLVDSFGPRGFPGGFPAGSYNDRPPQVSEQTVRPLDAYAGLRYLRTQRGVIADRIGVQGWSNGGMTVLATMSDQAPGKPESGFRAALAEYPGCSMDAIKGQYHSYAPILLLLAAEDEEVNPKTCEQFAKRAKDAGSPLESHVYPGAGHNYDDPEQRSNRLQPIVTRPRIRSAARKHTLLVI
jgi:carboxymethylenebutenolidase